MGDPASVTLRPRCVRDDDDLRLQFEAMSQLSRGETGVARAVLEGLLLKHVALRWVGPDSKPAQARRQATRRETVK